MVALRSELRTMRIIAAPTLAMALAACAFASARAEQVIPTDTEYTNDTIELGGELQGCVVTVAILTRPGSETVNFQYLFVAGRPGFKVAVGDIDWTKKSLVAKRISDANFYTTAFNHPTAFKKNVTPAGQLVANLIDDSLSRQFFDAFFGGGGYTIEFQRTDVPTVRSYYIERGPRDDVVSTFSKCVRAIAGNLPGFLRH
jgi:hypothetical protein